VPAAADNQVVVNGHTERLGGLDDVLGDGDVRLGGGRIARGMVVHHDYAQADWHGGFARNSAVGAGNQRLRRIPVAPRKAL
jgi:hypothetical protein